MTQKKKHGESVYRLPLYMRVVGSWVTLVLGVWGVGFLLQGIVLLINEPLLGLFWTFLGSGALNGSVLMFRAVFIIRLVLSPYGITSYDWNATYFTTWDNVKAIHRPGLTPMPSWSLPSTDFYKVISLILHQEVAPIWTFPFRTIPATHGIKIELFARRLWGNFIDTPLAHELKYYLPEQYAEYEDKLRRRGVLM